MIAGLIVWWSIVGLTLVVGLTLWLRQARRRDIPKKDTPPPRHHRYFRP